MISCFQASPCPLLPAPRAPASGGQPLPPVGWVALRGQGVAHTARAGEPSPVV